MHYVAPAGTPIAFSDLRRWLGGAPGKTAAMEAFREALMRRFQLAGCEFVSSGRAGLTLLLDTLHRLRGDPARTEVLIPAYTCYSVPASIERAGLRVRICDVNPETLDYDMARLEAFDCSRVLAILSANLYGIPNDLSAIETLARRRGIYMVDDAAQAMGATYADRAAGTFGDAGLFSLDKGKNITSMQGGILVTRSPDIASALRGRVGTLPPPASRDTIMQAAKMLVYAAMLHPGRYGLMRRLPFLGLGRTPYEVPSPLTRYSPLLGVMASILFTRLDTLGTERRANAQRIMDAVGGIPELTPITPPPGASPVYVRMPLLAQDQQTRDTMIRRLDEAGIGATGSYPTAIAEIPQLRPRLHPEDLDCPGARRVAEGMITLPTHPFLTEAHIRTMASVIRQNGHPVQTLADGTKS